MTTIEFQDDIMIAAFKRAAAHQGNTPEEVLAPFIKKYLGICDEVGELCFMLELIAEEG
jgi:hypothetical protein